MALRGDRPEPPAPGAPTAIQEPVEAPVPVVVPPPAQEAGPAEEAAPVAMPPRAEEPRQAETPLQAEVPVEEEPEQAAEPTGAPAARAPAAPVSFAFVANRFRVAEGAGALRLELRRPAGYRGPLNVHWRTVDQTARDGVDFSGSTGWQWAGTLPGTPSLVIFIPIVDDSLPGPDVTFRVELEQVPGGPVLGTPAEAEVTIVDDD
jgi:hypothetical protein